MQTRPTPLEVPDRPSKYITVSIGDLDLPFRLPNEKRQMELLQLIAGRMNRDGDSLQIIGSLDVLAVLVGVCWYHPTLSLDTPLPWKSADAAALVASSKAPEDSRKVAADAARWEALAGYGEEVLDELDEAGYGDRNTVGVAFGAISRAIGRNFLPQEDVDARLGFSEAGRASVG